jgi:hypothetical protein
MHPRMEYKEDFTETVHMDLGGKSVINIITIFFFTKRKYMADSIENNTRLIVENFCKDRLE